MKLYDYLPSGNSYKVRLLMAYLDMPYTHVPINILKGDTQTPEYLAKNPAGQIPLLELDDGRTLAESNAILYYLAQNTAYWPADVYAQAKAHQWMCFEQYKHEPSIAVARYIHHYAMDTRSHELAALMVKGHGALAVMETHLRGRDWFAGGAIGLADIALYAYTHVADEGGFDLAQYPAITAWLSRVADRPRHIRITDIPDAPL